MQTTKATADGMSGFLALHVRDVMTAPITIAASATLADAERVFEERGFNMLPVVEDGRLVGALSKLDLMKAFAFTNATLIPRYAEIMAERVDRYMNTAPFTVEADLPLTRALQQMVETRCKSLVVVRGGQLAGMVAREDVLRALRATVAGGSH